MHIHYITRLNVYGANRTHGTENEVFRGVKQKNPQYIELLRRILTLSAPAARLEDHVSKGRATGRMQIGAAP
jgi:hypothetical protein